MANDVYVATETFAAVVDGYRQVIRAGKTRVREGHPLVRDNPKYFKLDDVIDFDVEQATKAPGEKRSYGYKKKD